MKRLGFLTLLSLALFSAKPSHAQSTGGLLMDRDIMTPSDIYELTQTTFTFGTARSMAMAGAFTSLGADMSSMSINPAGLGMYRRSELSITPLISFTRSTNDAEAFNSNNKTRFTLANIGYTSNVYQGSGSIVSVNLGIGYNRLQDLNYNYSYKTYGNASSIADVFSDILQYEGINRDQITGSVNWRNIHPSLWPAVLGYKAGLTDQVNGQWRPTWIGDGVDIGNYTTVESRGYVGEYTIAAGMNINNKVYVGATWGIQSLHQRKNYYYGEDYLYGGNGTNPDLDYQLQYANFNQEVVLDGVGMNLKLGVIYRPIPNLRIGAAYHTPSYYWVDRRYQAYTDSKVQVNNNTENLPTRPDGTITSAQSTMVLEDSQEYDWEFTSPSRLMLGISYAFGNRGVLSVDYERNWYNGIRMKNNPDGTGNALYNETFRNWFQGANILRIGAEVKPHPAVAIRAGFGWMGNVLKDDKMVSTAPMAKSMLYGSGGLGFLLSANTFLDVAYSYSKTEYTDYILYSSDLLGGLNASRSYNLKQNRHSVALTLGFRF